MCAPTPAAWCRWKYCYAAETLRAAGDQSLQSVPLGGDRWRRGAGLQLGDRALKSMEELAKQNMLQGMSFSWTGLALEEVEAGGKAHHHLWPWPSGRVSHALGPIRELRAAVHHPAGRADGGAGRAGLHLHARTGGMTSMCRSAW